MSDNRLSLNEMCDEFDVTKRTLRYYEYIELLQPDREGRARFYGPRERARMKLIKRGQKFGFSLEEIRQWLQIYYEDEGDQVQIATFLELADRQLPELKKQREQLDEAIDALQELRDQTAKLLK